MKAECPLRVLVVEDEAPIAQLITANLGRVGLQVTTANTVAEARHCLKRESPALLILDSTLPDGEALSVLEDWQSRDQGGSVARPCLVLAPSPEQHAILDQRKDPWTRVIGKPFSPPELVMQVIMLLVEAGARVPPSRPVSSHVQKVVVDLCSGSGLSTCLAADEAGPFALVVGVDRSFETTCEAQRRVRLLSYQNVSFIVADVRALPFASGTVQEVHGTEDLRYVGLADDPRAREEVERIRGS